MHSLYQQYLTIQTNESLADFCSRLNAKKRIAVDTEFLRVSTFYPKLALIQVFDGEQVALIDPLGIDQWTPFVKVLENPDIVKVLHACDEDIEIFHHVLGSTPVNVFDTQVAAGLLGFEYPMGYQRLILQMKGEQIEKSASRSDWFQRPLSKEQLHYAIQDVAWLLDIQAEFSTGLVEKNLSSALDQLYGRLLEGMLDTTYAHAYKRVKSRSRLSGAQLARLKSLAVFREQMMRELDLPRNRIATNDALLTLVGKSNLKRSALFEIEGLSKSFLNKKEAALMEILQAEFPPVPPEKKLQKPDRLYRFIKTTMANIAEKNHIATLLLCRKDMLEAVYWSCREGWQLPDRLLPFQRYYYHQMLQAAKEEFDPL